jgi:protein SCO1/2
MAMGTLRRSALLAALLAALVAASACDDVRRFGARGIVEDVKPEQGQVLIDHEDIVGLMPAMTMNFDVPDPELLASLEPGQQISFTLVRTSRGYEVVDVLVLGMVEVGDEWARLGERLVRTTEAPAFELIDQDGRAVSSESLRGRTLLLDFIFTQCPGPCPILTARQVRVQRLLPDDLRTRIQLVSISLDPVNDTPEAMRAYAKQHGATLDNWSFLTGDPETVDAVVRSHHVGKTRNAEGEIEHLVISFLIDGRGRILRRYMGMADEAEEIVADLVAVATPVSDETAGADDVGGP